MTATANGKINKNQILRQIVARENDPYDHVRILNEANACLNTYSPQERGDLKPFSKQDVYNAVYAKRAGRKASNNPTPVKKEDPLTTGEGKPFTRSGKPNKKSIVREAVKGIDLSKPYDIDRIMLLSNNILAKFPPDKKEDVSFTKEQVYRYISGIREKEGLSSPTAPRKIQPPKPSAPPPDSYGMRELLCASALLKLCGHSQHRAVTLLKVVAEISEGEQS